MFHVRVNEEDHLQVMCMEPGSTIREVFKRLSVAIAAMEQHLQFAADQGLGHITS